MNSIVKRLFLVATLIIGISLIASLISGALLFAQSTGGGTTGGGDTLQLPYPFNDNPTDIISNTPSQSPLFLNNPANIQTNVQYNPETHEYDITETVGGTNFRNPTYMTFSEYYRNQFQNSTRDYWKQKGEEDNISGRKRSIPKIYVGGEAFDRIFGGNTVDIRPQGSAELIFGVNISKNDNPQIPEKQRRNTTFDFREKIQMNVIGNIGEKLRTSINYNTEATFDFENKMKLDYTGKEDEIIKKLEAGNVSLPLTGSLIQGSQSLFGLKTQLQFGRMKVTTVFSQQKSETKTINVAPGGAQTQDFDIKGDNYEANKHFFLAQYFRDNYDASLAQLPIILSGVSITKIEVWITNRTSTTTNTRNIVAFMDLGENDPYNLQALPGSGTFPNNGSNALYSQVTALGAPIRDIATINTNAGLAGTLYTSPVDYEKLENARMLSPSEYTFNGQLGYISLQSALNSDEILSVAFEYTANGQVFKVGELSSDGINPPQVLITKMLKSTNTNPRLPTWDLMMKNIYALGAYQLSQTDFRLDVLYEDDATGSVLNFLPTGTVAPNVNGKPLIKLLRLDNLNSQRDPQPDGMFDFIEGITVNSQNGRIIFPVVEPFGEFLREQFDPNNSLPAAQQLANNFVFDALYDSTLNVAQQQPERNKYRLKGTYQSQSSSEIQLNSFNIPKGSVVVTAGGIPLIENQQYTVDYNLGRVKIIDQSILNSNTPISVKVEDESLFSIQSKTLMGAHFDYDVAKDFTLGATIMRLSERPITRKVNIGDEPIANTIWGVDGTYNTESRFLTKLVDKLPLINTKEKSTVTFTGEFAHIIPGHAKAIGKNGVAYLDDFEDTQNFIPLNTIGTWSLASTPQGQNGLFPEASLINNLSYGFNRSRLAWYTIDPTIFYSANALRPSHITSADIYDNRVRQILEKELFPNAQNPNGIPSTLSMFDLAYYPAERGPYNYDALASSQFSAGTELDGTLKDPESRWAGITRRLETTDFEEANIEFIQFWIMDPFNSDEPNSFNDGELYFNLGNISEDVLRDSRKSFENGLPTPSNNAPVDTTAWGRVPVNQSLVPAFDNDANARDAQDVGLDGLSTTDEQSFFSNFLQNLSSLNANALAQITDDPASDNFSYYRGSDLDIAQASILERYKYYNGTDGNSPVATGSISASSTNVPDAEDINRDNTMSESESYYQYKIDIKPNMEIGTNFITDKVTRTVSASGLPDKQVTWYQFKVPVNTPTSAINGISDFKSIRFMRIFLKEFEDPIVLRFARLELVRGEWRKYPFDLLAPGEYITVEDNGTLFDINTVSLEENGDRSPINYVIPPGIDQEVNVSTSNLQKLNEQSLSLKVCNLEDGDARAGYKILNYDILNYNRLKMFVHAESSDPAEPLIDGDIRLFVRMGADFVSNYYEYEIPLTITNPGTTDPDEIWPELNELDISLDKLVAVKLARDKANAPFNVPYSEPDGTRTITVTGTPNLANVKTIMIGIRNPKKTPARPFDDGRDKCAEVWVNELRLTDFEEKGGWAANARVTAKLASLGTVTLTGNRKTIGFGGIEQTLNERSRSNDIGYEVAAQLKMDEFLPENTGLSIPMYFGYSEQFSTPQYNPLQPDVELQTALNNELNAEEKAELKKKVQDYTKRKSLNFTNVKKNKVNPASKSQIYDISNFDFTYAFSETFHRDINTEYDVVKTYKGAIGYNYNQQPKSYTPFTKLVGNGKALRPVKDFNYSLRPSALTFRTDLDRQYGERLLRNNTDFVAAIDTTFNKFFNWSRQYGMQWDLTKSIKLDFNANNQSRIDEPAGRIDTKTERDSILENIRSFGRNTNYSHQGNATYNVPLSKFQFLNFMSVNTKYGFDYSWTAAPLVRNSQNSLQANSFGNTIQNSNTKQLNTSLSMPTLYNKIPFYKNLNKPRAKKSSNKAESKPQSNTPQTAKDSAKVKKAQKPKQVSPLVKHLVNFVFSVKNVSVNYSETNGTSLPGYIRQSEILGLDLGKNSPGIPFILGSQKDIRSDAAFNGWLTEDTLLNVQYSKNFQQNLTGRANIEPFPGFRIDLNANRSFSRSNSEFFRYDPIADEFESFTPLEQGNFSMSFLTWNTAFVSQSLENSDLFEKFNQNRVVLSNRLANQYGYISGVPVLGILPADSSGVVYRDGFSGTQQEVLLYSFIAAYTDKNPQGVSLNQFPKIPKPNWRITYDGIGKMKWAKNIFRNVNLSHGYRSSYNINSYTTNVNYDEDSNGNSSVKDFSGVNYLPKNEMTQVTISEQFSPLIGVEVTLKNSLSLRADFKKDRSLSLAFTGIQLTEVNGEELTIGGGYRIKNFKLPFDKSKRDATGSDLNLTMDISRRNNETIIRKMIEQTNQRTAGLTVWSIKTSADYVVNERFNVRLFFDHTVNTPKISLSYPTANTNAGVSIRFTLSQ